MARARREPAALLLPHANLSAMVDQATQLQRLWDRQLGCSSRSQMATLGYSAKMLRNRIGDGSLVLLLPGVYGDPTREDCVKRRGLAACLYAGDGAALSHGSAAQFWQLPVPAPDEISVTIPATRSRSAMPGIEIHRTRSFTNIDRVRMGPLPLTSVSRTIMDLAEGMNFEEVCGIVDDAILRSVIPPGRLSVLVRRHEGRDLRGVVAVRNAVDAWLGDGVPESHAEIEVARWLASRGIPEPVRQYVVTDATGTRIVRLDFAWPEFMLALEIDGFRYHDGPAKFRDDRARTNWLVAQGWIVLHATVIELRTEPDTLECAIRRHMVPRDLHGAQR